jgi:hypothetical protein
MNWPNVTPDDRHGGKERCYYCREAVGTPHRPDCVKVVKRVKVRLTVEYEVEVPASWAKEDVEFHRNDGSWCSDNLIPELEALAESQGCLCGVTHFDYVADVPGPVRERV